MSDFSDIRIVLSDDEPAVDPRLENWSRRLGIPIVKAGKISDSRLLLRFVDGHLELFQPGEKMSGLWCDFQTGQFGRRKRNLRPGCELLLRAIGFKSPGLTVIDATAGLGSDAALMALAGCQVTALERSPILAALLQDGMDRAGASMSNLRLIQHDARIFLTSPDIQRVQVVYLDPMFPHRAKSALVGKEMRLIRMLTGDDADSGQLLPLARKKATSRIVVKRPLRAPALNGEKPAYDYRGKAVRFDVYLPL